MGGRAGGGVEGLGEPETTGLSSLRPLGPRPCSSHGGGRTHAMRQVLALRDPAGLLRESMRERGSQGGSWKPDVPGTRGHPPLQLWGNFEGWLGLRSSPLLSLLPPFFSPAPSPALPVLSGDPTTCDTGWWGNPPTVRCYLSPRGCLRSPLFLLLSSPPVSFHPGLRFDLGLTSFWGVPESRTSFFPSQLASEAEINSPTRSPIYY